MDHVKRNEEGNRQPADAKRGEENLEKPATDETRRGFLRKAVQVGLGMGLAHFLLLGGPLKKVSADDACPAPYGPAQDTCNATDTDVCKTFAPSYAERGDECKPPDDTDQCDARSQPDGDVCPDAGMPYAEKGDLCWFNQFTHVESGDVCGPNKMSEGGSPDLCTLHDGTLYGDECKPAISDPDVV